MVLGFDERDPPGLQPPLCVYHFLSVAQGTWTGPRAGFLGWHRASSGCIQSAISMNLAAVRRVRLEEAGSTDQVVSTGSPHVGCAHRKLPGRPSMSKATQERLTFFSQYCIRMTFFRGHTGWWRRHQNEPGKRPAAPPSSPSRSSLARKAERGRKCLLLGSIV